MNKTEKSDNMNKIHSQWGQKPIRRVRNGPADSNTWHHWNQWGNHLIRAWSASQVQGICCIAAVSSKNSYNRLKWTATEVLRGACNHKSRGITWKMRERTKVRNQWRRVAARTQWQCRRQWLVALPILAVAVHRGQLARSGHARIKRNHISASLLKNMFFLNLASQNPHLSTFPR